MAQLAHYKILENLLLIVAVVRYHCMKDFLGMMQVIRDRTQVLILMEVVLHCTDVDKDVFGKEPSMDLEDLCSCRIDLLCRIYAIFLCKPQVLRLVTKDLTRGQKPLLNVMILIGRSIDQ